MCALGCTGLNPAYGDDAAVGSGGEAASGVPASTGGSTGVGGSTSAPSASTDADSTGAPSLCGDGNLDDGEACDDGNTKGGDACAPDCTLLVSEDWRDESEVLPGVRARFNDVVFASEGIVAVGRGVAEGDALERATLTHYTLEGMVTGRARVPGFGHADALGAFGDGDLVYVAGLELAGPQVAIAARVDFADLDAPVVDWTQPIDGTRATSLLIDSGRLVVGTGLFDGGGLGFSFLDPATGEVAELGGVDTSATPSQIYALLADGGELYGAGMLNGSGFVAAFADLPMLEIPAPLYVQDGDSAGNDRFQALAVEPDGSLVVGGSVFGTAQEGENAWIGVLDPDAGDLLWSVSVDAGSQDDDEVEDLAVDDDGDIIAVGMLGDPPQPQVWKFHGGTGDLLWSIPILAPGLYGMARGVVVDEGAVFVVGEHRANVDDTAAWVVRLTDHS